MDEMLGGTRITYMGHATFRVVTPGGEQIIVDPFLSDNPQTPEDLKEVQELDIMLITHGHFDHFADAIPVAQETGAMTVANFEIFSYLQGKGIENGQPIQKGGTVQIGGIQSPRLTPSTPRASPKRTAQSSMPASLWDTSWSSRAVSSSTTPATPPSSATCS